MIQNEVPKAIPLWIGGHAFLTVTHNFHEVRDARTGAVLRRVPSCGSDELEAGLAAARSALGTWAGMPPAHRISLLAALGNSAAKYSAHLAGLLREELGLAPDAATGEVERSVALLRNASHSDHDGVVAIVGNREAPLLGTLEILVPLLAGGATALILPSVDAPSVPLALAELSVRCGFPDGVLNVVYADQNLIERLNREPDVRSFP